MTDLCIRQSGGANIISIPKAILRSLNLHPGSSLSLSIKNHAIVLTPVEEKPTLKSLLAGSPKAKLSKTEEDDNWLNIRAVGEEIE